MLALAAATMLSAPSAPWPRTTSTGCSRSSSSATSATCCSGSALFTVAGLTGAILYLVHHIVVQAALFLVSDIMQ